MTMLLTNAYRKNNFLFTTFYWRLLNVSMKLLRWRIRKRGPATTEEVNSSKKSTYLKWKAINRKTVENVCEYVCLWMKLASINNCFFTLNQ